MSGVAVKNRLTERNLFKGPPSVDLSNITIPAMTQNCTLTHMHCMK